MQEPRSNSTLELVVNEQQMHNMSQIDLRPGSADANQQAATRLNNYLAESTAQSQANQESGGNMFRFEELKNWPTRFRESFQNKLDQAKARSETRSEYVIEVIRSFSGIIIWVLCFCLTIILPIVLFFIGLAHLDGCANRPSLPYLVTAIGFFMTLGNLFNLALALEIPILSNHKSLTNDVKNIIASLVNIIFNSVVAFLYIVTAYMVFNINSSTSQTTDSNEQNPPAIDCNATLYGFTYWFVVLTLGSFATLSVLATILYGYNRYRLAIIRGSTPRSHQTNNGNGAATQQNLNTAYSTPADRI